MFFELFCAYTSLSGFHSGFHRIKINYYKHYENCHNNNNNNNFMENFLNKL